MAGITAFILLFFATHVDPLIGTEGGGNTFPGATTPFGVVRLSPDTDLKNPSGYDSRGKIVGFSHTHVSGVGVPKYGNILVMPADAAAGPGAKSRKTAERAAPGYYRVTLQDYNISAELTATRHVGVHRYRFGDGSKPRVLVDVGHTLYGGAAPGMSSGGSKSVGGRVYVDPARGEIRGFGIYEGGWSPGRWTVYFALRPEGGIKKYGVWKQDSLGRKKLRHGVRASGGKNIGAFFEPALSGGTRSVVVKVGISFMGVHQARHYIDREARGWDFDAVKREAAAGWENQLSKITVEGGTGEQKKIFYSALYHSFLMPTDMTGENPYFNFPVESYHDDYFCLWDTFRTVHPLLTLVETRRNTRMMRTLVDIYRQKGWMPDGWTGGSEGYHQVGTSGDVVMADSFVKGLDGIDYETAYRAMVKNAEKKSPDPRHIGRLGIAQYKKLGYVPFGYNNSVSRTLEYAHNDYAISVLAGGLGKTQDARKYLRRSLNYRKLWDASSGFMRGRYATGGWIVPFDPDRWEHWGTHFYEGNAWHWSWFVPHDMAGLIGLHGGEENFVARLEEMLLRHYNPGNEPDMNNAWLFNYAGRPDRTQHWTRKLLENYNSTRAGIPGNDDAGALSAWYVFAALGFYPVAGQDVYLLSRPLFRRAKVHLESGHDFVIETHGEGGYIESATLDGRALDRAWLTHAEIAGGGTLKLVAGPSRTTWAARQRPPSVSTSGRPEGAFAGGRF